MSDDKRYDAQYDAALRDMSAAMDAKRAATNDDELSAATERFTNAQRELDRILGNRADDETMKRYTPIEDVRASDDPNRIGMDTSEVREYSLLRALNAQLTGNWKGAEMEREASEAVAQRIGKTPNGFFVPMDVQERAGMSTGDATFAGNLVATNLLGASFVDILRNKPSVTAAGCTYLSGLVGNIAIPRQTGAITDYWIGATDNSAITGESHPTVDQITMTPKKHGAYTDIGRELLLQASVDPEMLVMNDIARVLGLGLDAQALYGTGQTVYPKGVATQTNVGSVACGTNGAAPTWANVVDLETKVATANADDGNLAYIVNAKARGYFKSTPKVATYSATMMWDSASPSTPLNGYRAVVSNQVRSTLTKASGTGLSEIYFGNWSNLIVGRWGTLDLLVDPYTGGTAGTVRIIALEDIDVCVRHGESFARIADAVV